MALDFDDDEWDFETSYNGVNSDYFPDPQPNESLTDSSTVFASAEEVSGSTSETDAWHYSFPDFTVPAYYLIPPSELDLGARFASDVSAFIVMSLRS